MRNRKFKTSDIAKIKLMFRDAGLEIKDIQDGESIEVAYKRLKEEKMIQDQLAATQRQLDAEFDTIDPAEVERQYTPLNEIQLPLNWDQYCNYMHSKNEGWIIWDSHYKHGKVLIRVLDKGPKLD